MARRGTLGWVKRTLERRRRLHSSAQPRYYVGPLGVDLARVKPRPSASQSIVVASPGRTFAPNALVWTLRHAGDPGETIAAPPSPGRKGASSLPAAASGGQAGAPAVAAATGYLAISNEDAGGVLWAWHYDGADYVATLGSLDLSAIGASGASRPSRDPLTDTVAMLVPGRRYLVWSIADGASWLVASEAVVDEIEDQAFAPWIWSGFVYYGVIDNHNGGAATVYRFPLATPAGPPHQLVGRIFDSDFTPAAGLVDGPRIDASGSVACRVYDSGSPAPGASEWWGSGGAKQGSAHLLGAYDPDVNPGAAIGLGWLYYQASYGLGAGSAVGDRSVIVAADNGAENYLWPSGWTGWADASKVHVAASPAGDSYAAFFEQGESLPGELVTGDTLLPGTGAWSPLSVNALPSPPTSATRPRYMLPRA